MVSPQACAYEPLVLVQPVAQRERMELNRVDSSHDSFTCRNFDLGCSLDLCGSQQSYPRARRPDFEFVVNQFGNSY